MRISPARKTSEVMLLLLVKGVNIVEVDEGRPAGAAATAVADLEQTNEQ